MSNLFRKNKFTNISNILPKVVEKLGLDRRLNEQALFCIWRSLLEEVYSARSIPLYIDQHNILIVAVEDSSTAQELSFIKTKLMEKLKLIAPQFGLRVDGLRFDLKQYTFAKQEQIKAEAAKSVECENTFLDCKNQPLNDSSLTEAELIDIDNFKTAMQNATAKLEQFGLQSPEELAQRIAKIMEKQLRLTKWHESKNLPFCELCHEPLFQLNVELCHYCFQQEKERLKDNKRTSQ